MKKTTNYEAAVRAQYFRNEVFAEVISALELAAENDGLTKTEIANKLGFSKAYISTLLSGPGNWTLDTVSNLMFATNSELICRSRRFCDRPRVNHYHWLEDVKEMGSPRTIEKNYRSTRKETPKTSVPALKKEISSYAG